MINIAPELALLIRKHQKVAPINIISIAHDLKINVYKAIGEVNLAGKIVKDAKHGGESGYAIFVNASDSHKRQRFTIAHEIAHYVLHKAAVGDGIVEDALYRSGLSNKQEVQAHKLAVDMLMPLHLINQAMDNGIKTIVDLAKTFQVSESAMSIRLGIPS